LTLGTIVTYENFGENNLSAECVTKPVSVLFGISTFMYMYM